MKDPAQRTLRRAIPALFAVSALALAQTAFAADWTDANDPAVTYTALKSINGDASGYINTGIIPAGTEGVRFKYKSTAVSTTQCIYCSRWKKSSTWQYYFTCVIASSKFRVDRAKTQYTCNTAGTLTAGEEYSLFANYNTGTVTINGTDEAGSMGTGAYTSSTPSHPLVLLGAYIGGGTASAPTVPSVDTKANGDLYYFQLWSSTGVLEHNFMPAVRDSNSSDTGLYDTVTGTFYPATDGSFTGISYGAAERAGKKWTGLGADNKMSTAANWANNDKPGAGDDIDFTIAVPFAEIDADINATFGKVYLGAADLPAFSGALTATAINDLTRMQAYDTATAGFTFTLAAPSGQDFTWNAGAAANWWATDVWTYNNAASSWFDNNNAIFTTANATVTLDEDATADSLAFNADATVSGSSTLTVPTVSVASGVSVVISAPTAGALEKTGAGTLTLGSSRTTATTVTEGTLKMLSGATVSTQSSGAADLTLGTSDPTKRVVFDYGGQTLSATPDSYLVTGANVTLTNGTFRAGGNNNSMQLRDTTSIPAVLTIAKDATLSKYGTSGGNLVLLKTNDVATINIAGGEVHSGKYGYIQHAAETGTLNINVTEGGRLSIADNLHALCDGTAGASPSLNMMFAGSTFDAGANFHFGNATTAAFPVSPSGMFAATNSAVNVATGFYIGRNTQDEKTAGFYKADFENCAVTTRYFAVYHDRPLNNARFNGTTLTFSNAGSIAASDGAANWITVGPNGMTFDTQSHYATLNANLGGEGAVAKIGAGTLTVASNQTAIAALNVNAGTLAVNGGVSVSRPITIASGATLTVNATDTATIDALALEAGSTLNIASYDGTTPFAVATSATLPAEGTVNLTLNGGAFPVGIYAIYSKSGVVAADGEKFAPSTGELGYSWSLVDSALVLTVGYVDPNAWTGLAGDSRMSSPGNWAGNAVPAAGADIDLSGISADTTIIADANRTFGAVTMGTGVVTFTNAFAVTSFSDTTKVAVGADSTVTLVGDLVFATNVTACICHSIAAGGMFAVTGDIIASAEHTGYVIPCIGQDSIPGTISCKGIVNNAYNQDYFYIVRAKSNTLANWLVGEDGISGTSRFFIQRSNYRNSYANIRAQADFTVSADIRQGFNLTLDTAGYTITLGTNTTTKSGGILGGAAGGMTTVTGAGRVVVNYNVNDLTTAASSRTNAFTVANGGTLAFAPGGNIGFGDLTVQDGGTLEIQSGTTTFGNLTVEENAILGFNFTDRRVVPQLALYDGAEVTALDPFTVKVSGTVWPSGGEKILTTCGGFDGIPLTLSAVGEAARWAKPDRLSVNGDYNIVLDVKPMGTMILFR